MSRILVPSRHMLIPLCEQESVNTLSLLFEAETGNFRARRVLKNGAESNFGTRRDLKRERTLFSERAVI